jgi:hypothetical protein
MEAGEQGGASHGHLRLTAIQPLNVEQYCAAFSSVIEKLRVPVRAA